MKDQVKEKIVLLTLNDNKKLEGVLIKIDKENLKIILEKGKETSTDGSVKAFDKAEIFKKDIKEIRLVEEKEKPKEIETPTSVNKQEKPEIKNTEDTFNAIPLNIQEKYQNDNAKYDKDGFFDGLTISNNKDNYKEIKTYNEKNKETFGIDDTYEGNRRGRGGNNRRGKRGGYYGHNNYNNNNNYRGRGGYGNYNNNNSRGEYGNNNNQSHYNNGYNNYNNYNHNRGGHGHSGYGNYNNNYNNSNNGYNNGYNNYNHNNNNSNYNNNNNFYSHSQYGIKSETVYNKGNNSGFNNNNNNNSNN